MRTRDPWRGAMALGPLAWCRDHARVSRDSFTFVAARLTTSIVVWLLIGIALALPGGLYLLERNLEVATDAWQGRPGLSVYLERDAPAEAANELEARMRTSELLDSVTLVTAEAALEEFEEAAGLSDALALLEVNPLPASLRAALAEGVPAVALDALVADLAAAPGVDEVVIEKTWLERLAAMSETVERLGWVLAVMFALGAVLVTSTSVRLAIESRLEELKVQKLVGATDAFVRRPFLYFGFIYGVGGAVVAGMLLSAVLLVLEPPLARLLGSYGGEITTTGFDLAFVGALLALGGMLGVAGALLATRARLHALDIV